MTKRLKEIAKQMMDRTARVTNILSGEKLKKDLDRNINLFLPTILLMPLWSSLKKYQKNLKLIFIH